MLSSGSSVRRILPSAVSASVAAPLLAPLPFAPPPAAGLPLPLLAAFLSLLG
jgi:hypothetical protein